MDMWGARSDPWGIGGGERGHGRTHFTSWKSIRSRTPRGLEVEGGGILLVHLRSKRGLLPHTHFDFPPSLFLNKDGGGKEITLAVDTRRSLSDPR